MIPRKLNKHLDKALLIKHFHSDIVGEDRRLRFGYMATDEAVTTYITNSLENGYGVDNTWFVVVEGFKVIASVHVAYNSKKKTAELGLTVSNEYRGKKLGQELFNRGVLWARAVGAESIFMYCLSENKTMQHIAKKNNMTIVTLDPSEKEAVIKITKSHILAGMEDMALEQIAIFDSAIRGQRWAFWKIIENSMKGV